MLKKFQNGPLTFRCMWHGSTWAMPRTGILSFPGDGGRAPLGEVLQNLFKGLIGTRNRNQYLQKSDLKIMPLTSL